MRLDEWKGMDIFMKKIAILGSTGSIGTQTLEIVREQKDIEVTAFAPAASAVTSMSF